MLPLQLFTIRAELDKITADKTEKSKETAITKAKAAINKIVPIVELLYQEYEIEADDNDKIITGLAELINHLDERYELNKKLNGVNDVIKVLNIAKKAERKGGKQEKIRTATDMLLDGEPISKIMKYTKLTEGEIQKIKNSM